MVNLTRLRLFKPSVAISLYLSLPWLSSTQYFTHKTRTSWCSGRSLKFCTQCPFTNTSALDPSDRSTRSPPELWFFLGCLWIQFGKIRPSPQPRLFKHFHAQGLPLPDPPPACNKLSHWWTTPLFTGYSFYNEATNCYLTNVIIS
jgi:hypothetical protein